MTEEVIGNIDIQITKDEISFNSPQFSEQEIIFWLECVKQLILESVLKAANSDKPV